MTKMMNEKIDGDYKMTAFLKDAASNQIISKMLEVYEIDFPGGVKVGDNRLGRPDFRMYDRIINIFE